jgi:SHS2 domain-containing protein
LAKTVPYQFLEHTADIAFEASAADLSDLFTVAAEALLHSMVGNPESVRNLHSIRAELRSSSLDLLLLSMLQEPVYYKDSLGLLLRAKTVRVEGAEEGWRVAVEWTGEMMDPHRHQLCADVKAVTLYRLQVAPTETGWSCHVVLDV